MYRSNLHDWLSVLLRKSIKGPSFYYIARIYFHYFGLYVCTYDNYFKYTRTKKKRRVAYKDSFKGYNVLLHYILKTNFIGYSLFYFRPSNSEQDISPTDFHYSRPCNKIIMLHILCTRRFFFVLVYMNWPKVLTQLAKSDSIF